MVPRQTPDKFWNRVDQSGGPDACWPWTGSKLPAGYGMVARNGKKTYTHRLAYEYANGAPPQHHVCHLCDNPCCCNPAHLVDQTSAWNAQNRVEKGRSPQRLPRRLTDDQVREMRERHASGKSALSMSKEYGVSRALVDDILHRRVYKDI